MYATSYTLSHSAGVSKQPMGGFFNLRRRLLQRFARTSPPLPRGLAGINLVTSKVYKNVYPPTDGISKRVSTVFSSLGLSVRERFARDYKPVDHLGGASPASRIPYTKLLTIHDIDQDLEDWPKVGSTFEDMDILVN